MKQLNWYQIFGKSNIPDGRTVEPTDDIQIWLHCADIWDKTYTTLAEVLADTDTLLALISSNNAVDYMVRSTTWAVAQALVPTMTSNTTPEGECFGSGILNASYDYFKALDNDSATYWHSAAAAPQYVGYKFDSAVAIKKIDILCNSDGVIARNPSASKLQASNDGVNWVDIADVGSVPLTQKTVTFNNDTEYLYYRYYISATVGYLYTLVNSIQFYSDSGITENATAMTYIGQNNYASNTLLADATWRTAICNSEYFESVLNAKVPVMTSNTTPEGVASSSSNIASYDPWKAFDGTNLNEYDCWHSDGVVPQWLAYQFTATVDVAIVTMTSRNLSNNGVMPATFKIQGSNDGNTWVDLGSYTWTHGLAGNTSDTYFVSVPNSYQRFRMYGESAVVSGAKINMGQLQFYGRKDI